MTTDQTIESNAAYFSTACEFCHGTGIYTDLQGRRYEDPNCGGTGRTPELEEEVADPCPFCGGDHDMITQADCPAFAMTADSLWIKYDDQRRWHITGYYDTETRCGKSVTGEEEAETYIPWDAERCHRCERIEGDKPRSQTCVWSHASSSRAGYCSTHRSSWIMGRERCIRSTEEAEARRQAEQRRHRDRQSRIRAARGG